MTLRGAEDRARGMERMLVYALGAVRPLIVLLALVSAASAQDVPKCYVAIECQGDIVREEKADQPQPSGRPLACRMTERDVQRCEAVCGRRGRAVQSCSMNTYPKGRPVDP